MTQSYPGFPECWEIKRMSKQWLPGARSPSSAPGFEAKLVDSHRSQTSTLYGKKPLRKSVKGKLAFVRYCKGLPRHEGA